MKASSVLDAVLYTLGLVYVGEVRREGVLHFFFFFGGHESAHGSGCGYGDGQDGMGDG